MDWRSSPPGAPTNINISSRDSWAIETAFKDFFRYHSRSENRPECPKNVFSPPIRRVT
jgi:hypothetical protein